MITIINDLFMVCDDCLPYIANGDATHLDYFYSEEEAYKRLREIEQGVSRAGGYISPGEEEKGLEFSSIPCDCCGNTDSGARHHCVVFRAD